MGHSKLEFTGAIAKAVDGDSTFDFKVCRNNGGFVVYIKQTTVFEGDDDFVVNYRHTCKYARTEHDAIHEAGQKYLKRWNDKARIGKDSLIVK